MIKEMIYIVLISIFLYMVFPFMKFLYYRENTDSLLPELIDIEKHIVIKLDKDIHSYLEATLYISVLNTIQNDTIRKQAYKYEAEIKKLFPKKTIKVCLYHSNDKTIKFCDYNNGYTVILKDDLLIEFSFEVDSLQSFNRIEIETKTPIKKTKIGWENWSM